MIVAWLEKLGALLFKAEISSMASIGGLDW
jgi:hypothetical protein